MINIENITIRLGGNLVIDNASASLPTKGKIGIVGRNGCGKSTLLKTFSGLIEPDSGIIKTPKKIKIGYVAQHAPSGVKSPLDIVLEADHKRSSLLNELENCIEPSRVSEIYEQLKIINASAAPARAARILSGLGFNEEEQNKAIDNFSGGWRMRVSLAAVLFSEPDLLLLDEPSNHLDLEAQVWLESFLKKIHSTLLIVSHERDLLNSVVDHILHINLGKMNLYPGNYDSYEKQKYERQSQVDAMRLKQETKRKELNAFIDRWRYKAHSARQAQSRMKALSKLEPIAMVTEDPNLVFDFPSPNELRPPLITLSNAEVGYEEKKSVLSKINLRIDPDDRIALIGKNGNGKSTFIKLLYGDLKASDGEINFNSKIRIGYFAQHQIDELILDETPIDHMTKSLPLASPLEVRNQLGRFGFSGDLANRKVKELSGGERSRLALAIITRNAPHILLLDEPSNHLDVDARDSLVQALNIYQGAVIIVSHDKHLLQLSSDKLILLKNGVVKEFSGSLDDYEKMVISENKNNSSKKKGDNKKEINTNLTSRKGNRKISVEIRNQNKKLVRRLKESEKNLNLLISKKEELDKIFLDVNLFKDNSETINISKLMKERSELDKKIKEEEKIWITTSEKIESSK